VISYKNCNEVTRLATLEQLVPLVRRFSGLTTIILTSVVVNFELLEALGTLPHLSSLTYDASYPYDQLELRAPYGHFKAKYLNKRLHLLPKNLKEISFGLSCADIEEKAVDFLLSILSASRETLSSLTMDLQPMLGALSLRHLCKMYFPCLSTMAIYYADPIDWPELRAFCSEHAAHLRSAEILFFADGSEPQDYLCMADIPGLEDSVNEAMIGRAAMVMRGNKEDPKSKDKEEPPHVVLEELALEWCRCSMLKTIGKIHPIIRVLNLWELDIIPDIEDGSDTDNTEDDSQSRLPIEVRDSLEY
jgi:hypothetical protein